MKTVIIPDIHNRFVVAESIIRKERPDKIVLLGDYFDSFDDVVNIEMVSQTANWLAESVKKPERVHLFGNHDVWYSHHSCPPYCAGNTEFKYFIIKQSNIDWSRLRFHYWVNDILCTHAGLSNLIYKEYSKHHTVFTLMDEVERLGIKHPLVSLCGEARGGIEGEVGGILWCDYSEFEPIEGVAQIFGHSNGREPRLVEADRFNMCLDTGLHYYIIYDGKGLTIKKA